MSRLHFEGFIKRSPETIFQLLADLPGYAAWLPFLEFPLAFYKVTTDISDHPIKLGTTYSDKGPSSEMHGEVTEFEPYSHLAFHQMAHFLQFWPGRRVEMRIRYTLQPGEDGTQVIRDVEVHAQDRSKVVPITLLQAIRNENKRILQRMKWYLEAR